MFICCRLIPAEWIDRARENQALGMLRQQLVREAMQDAERRGVDLLGRLRLHMEDGMSGAPRGQVLVVAYGPAWRPPDADDDGSHPTSTLQAVD